ncbi:MAG: F0F1 ATP synthase subunit B [Lachnospiraceae bacterium]|nr:F0F1 ATP synthase subunit B [Lachnospiraceae bacterium]
MSGVTNVLLNGNALGDYIFGLDPQLLIDSAITILAMFVLVLFLTYLLFVPARQLLEKRQAGIREQMETAASEKQDAIQFKAEYDAKLKNVDKEADEILSEARKKAMKKEGEIVAEAKEEANRILDRANHEVELEKNKVKDDVKQEIISVATVMAGKIVASSLDEGKQSQLIADTLEEMGDETWLS